MPLTRKLIKNLPEIINSQAIKLWIWDYQECGYEVQ